MIPDAEIVRIIVDVFEALGLREDITIKINHRKILDGLFTVAGVPEDKIRSISSAVDKLDKVCDEYAAVIPNFTNRFIVAMGGSQEGNGRKGSHARGR